MDKKRVKTKEEIELRGNTLAEIEIDGVAYIC